MHIVFGTRGALESVNKFIRELSSQYLPFDYKGQKTRLQVRVSPVQIWDVSFPKEHEERMLNHLFSGGDTKSLTKKLRKFLGIFRMALGLKKIDDFEPSDKDLGILKPQNMDIFAIGKKEDRIIEDKDGSYEGI